MARLIIIAAIALLVLAPAACMALAGALESRKTRLPRTLATSLLEDAMGRPQDKSSDEEGEHGDR
jgi:hypothetical protein